MTTNTATYSLRCTDTETPYSWTALVERCSPPRAQDSGRVHFEVLVSRDQVEAFEASLDADDDVLEYSELATVEVVEDAFEFDQRVARAVERRYRQDGGRAVVQARRVTGTVGKSGRWQCYTRGNPQDARGAQYWAGDDNDIRC